MKKSQITATLQTDVQTVWQVVTNNKDYSWRRDVARLEESADGKEFTEYAANGFATKFVITKQRPNQLYAFEIDSKTFHGFWFGTFEPTSEGGTKIVFTENIEMKSPLLKLLSTVFLNLQKMQRQYVEDLRKKLGEA